MLGDIGGMDLDDIEAALLIGQRNLNLAIETTRSQQRGVQRVWTIGGHDHLHLAQRVEAVQLVQQLGTHQHSDTDAKRKHMVSECMKANRVRIPAE